MCADPTPEDLAKYRKAVQVFFDLKTKEPITNSIPAHAAVLLEQFFVHAQASVRILCKNLSKTVYDREPVIEAACAALKRGVDVEIIMQDATPDAEKFAHVFCKHGGELFHSTDPTIQQAPFNFAVMDQQAVRVERCNDKCEAVASIQSDIAHVLCDVFRILRTKGVQPLHV